MAHAPGWIELYTILEEGRTPSDDLVSRCRANRNGLGENVLQWYAIEGDPRVLQRFVELGFDVDNVNECDSTPILDAARIERWDNVRVLRAAGADLDKVTATGETYRSLLTGRGAEVPADLRADAYSLADLLDPDCPPGATIMSLVVIGDRLTAETWARHLAADPDLEQTFEFHPESPMFGAPHAQALFPDLADRRRVHDLATHFDARVVWELACPGSD